MIGPLTSQAHLLPHVVPTRAPVVQTMVGRLPQGPFAAMLSAMSCLHIILYFIVKGATYSKQRTLTGLAQGLTTSALSAFGAR